VGGVMEIIKDVLNRLGTKAIVAVFSIYCLHNMATKEGQTIPIYWFIGGIVFLACGYYVVDYFHKGKNGKPEENGG
jgi:hypothetical protein